VTYKKIMNWIMEKM